jgi:hypothetical protein
MRPHRPTPIDIRPSCNRSLRDGSAGDGHGWADQGPLHDMRLLPQGRQRFAGIPFAILPATRANARQCIAVGGTDMKQAGLPTRVSNIRIARHADSLVFLHTCSLDTYMYGKPIAEYVVHYADGTEKVISLRTYRNIISARKPTNYTRSHDQAKNSGYILDASRAWVGLNLAGDEIDVQAYEWVNRQPEKKIAGIDLRMTCHDKEAAVFLLGLTAVRGQ